MTKVRSTARTFWVSAALALAPSLASAQMPTFNPHSVLFAQQLTEAFNSVCLLSGCSLTGPFSVAGVSFLNGGLTVKNGLTLDSLTVSGLAALNGGATVPTPSPTDTGLDVVNAAWVRAQGYTTTTASGVTSFDGRNGSVSLTGTDVTTALGYSPAASTASVITGGLTVSGGETLTGGLSPDRITINQSGSSPLSSVLSLTRSAGGLSDSPLVSSSYTITAADGTQVGYNIANWTTTITGASGTGPAGDTYAVISNLNINALRSTVAPATGSQAVAVTGNTVKNTPAGGIPAGRKAQDGWAFWGPLTNNLNGPSSQGGADVNIELDQNTNGLDDLGARFIVQGTAHEANTGGLPADIGYGFYLSGSANTQTSMWDLADLGGAYSSAGLDFRFAASYEPSITSATPGSPTNSVTVDNILPLASGGTLLASTSATTGITANGAASGTTLTVSSAAALRTGMFVYDLTNTGRVPAGTTISSISTNTLTLSASTTVANTDTLLFAPGQKSVTINGDAYTVAGVSFTGNGSPAGTVWFTGNVTVADATNGVKIVPSSHTVWLWEGSASAPVAQPGDIAFNRAGTVTLACNSNSSCTDIKSSAPIDLPGNPTSPLQATTKAYVDNAVSVGGTYNPASVVITGGTINNTTIGGTTPAAGTFSSLSDTGTGAFQMPSGTTAQEPGSPTAGMERWNTTTGRLEDYNGSAWVNHVRLSGDTMTGALTIGSGDLVVSAGGLQSTKTINYGTGSGTSSTNQNLKVSGQLTGLCNDVASCTINSLADSNDTVFSGPTPLLLFAITYNNSTSTVGSRWTQQINTNANSADASYGTTWTASTPYAANALVHPPANGTNEGNVYQNFGSACTSGTTQPTGTAASGISDGGCTNWGYVYSNAGYGSLRITTTLKASQGGFDTTAAGSFGTNFAFNPAIRLKSGAVNETAAVSQENDCSMATGSSAYKFSCVQFVLESAHAVPGSHVDQILALSAQNNAAGVRNVLVIGEPSSQEPWAAGGTLIGSYLGDNYGTHDIAAGVGLDFKDVTFTDYSVILPHAGFDPNGGLLSGHAYLSTNSTGASLDTTGRETTAATVNTGGTGCALNDLVEGANHGVWKITQLTSGAASLVSQIKPGRFNGTSPPATVTTTARAPSNCSGVVLAPTWEAAQNVLQLNNSGGETDIGGGLKVGSPTGNYMGAGTINAQAIYIQGVAVSTGSGTGGAAAGVNIRSTGTSYTATTSDLFIGVKAGGAFTINLPTCSSSLAGQIFHIFDDSYTARTITITPASGTVANAVSDSFSSTTTGGAREYICDGFANYAGIASR